MTEPESRFGRCAADVGVHVVAGARAPSPPGSSRALLCNLCNADIGHLRDDPKVMQAAIEYVTFHANRLAAED